MCDPYVHLSYVKLYSRPYKPWQKHSVVFRQNHDTYIIDTITQLLHRIATYKQCPGPMHYNYVHD